MNCRYDSDTCPHYEAKSEYECVVFGCKEEAIYEGWLRLRDCLGIPTGHLVLVQICSTHKTHPWLVANEKSQDPKIATDENIENTSTPV